MGKVGKFFVGIALGVAGVLLSPVTGGASLALVGVGLNMVTKQLFGPARLANRTNAIRQNIANPLANIPVTYGTFKVGLRLVDMRLHPSNAKKLLIVGAVTHGSSAGLGINAFKRIWFDEKLAFDAAGTLQAAFKKGGTDYASVTQHLGTSTQAVDTALNTLFPAQWTVLHQGRGIAYLVFELTLHKDIFQNIPSISVEVEGAKVMDPRQASLTYSFLPNPALAGLDYLLNPVYGYAAGRRQELAAAAVTNSGMGSFSAANVVDGDPLTVGWSTDAAVSGAFIQFSFDKPVELDRVDLWMQDAGYAGTYAVRYSDVSGSGYTSVTGLSAAPVLSGRNVFRWPSHVTGAHLFWRVQLTNTPGAGVEIMGADWFESEIDYQSVVDEANACDVATFIPPVEAAFKTASALATGTGPATVTAHGWTTGSRVTLALRPGFTSCGLVNAGAPLEGQAFDITVTNANQFTLDGGALTGTYVANSLRIGVMVTEVVYAIHGALDTADNRDDNLRQILACGRIRLIYQQRKIRLHSRKTTSVSVTLTDEDIRSIRWVTPGSREKANRCRVSTLDATTDWQPAQREYPPPGIPNTYLKEDLGFSSDLDADLPLVTSVYQGDRVARTLLMESRDGISIDIVTGSRGMLAQVGDLVGLTHGTSGWVVKPFWVEAIGVTPEFEPVLSLLEYEPNCYTPLNSQLRSSIPNTSLPDATAIPAAPTSLVLTAGDAELLVAPNGDFFPRIKAAWTLSTNPYIDYYEVQAKRTADANYDTQGTPTDEDTFFFVGPVQPEVSWDVQVRAVTTLGVVSAWLTGTVVVSPVTRTPARGVVEFFETFPGSPARWTSLSGAATPAVVASSDSQYGGKVLQCSNGNKSYVLSTYIPFDRNLLYSLRTRIRQLRDRNGAIDAAMLLGFTCCDANLNELGINGAAAAPSGVAALWNAQTLTNTEILAWNDLKAFVRGWNGAWYLPPAGVVSATGFSLTSAAAVGDGSILGDAFNWDGIASGAALVIDLGASVTKLFCRARVWLAGTGSMTAQFKLQHATTSAGPWTDVTLRGGGVTWNPTVVDGWSEIDWDTTALSARRCWRLLLNNTPGATEPNCMEFQLLEIYEVTKYVTHSTWPNPDDPCPLPPGTAYIRPFFEFAGDGTITDAIQQIDMFEFPPAAGAPALV